MELQAYLNQNNLAMRQRTHPEHNYSSIFVNGKTLRFVLDPTNPISKLNYPELVECAINTICLAGCNFCVHPTTLIKTNIGYKPITEIRVGDLVPTLNENTNQPSTDPVEQLHVSHFSGELVVIELENGKKLKLTPTHKVFTQRGKVMAKDLKETDILTHF